MEELYATIGISNRHVHLTEEVYNELFDEEIEVKNNVNQKGEYAAVQTVTLKTEKGTIENVRVMGPCRDYNQVELARSDAYILGLNPPARESGDLDGSETVTVITPKGEVVLPESTILAQRHVHMNPEDAKKYGYTHGEKVRLIVDNDRGGCLNANIKIKDNGYFEVHLDRDEANAFSLNNGDKVRIEKCSK